MGIDGVGGPGGRSPVGGPKPSESASPQGKAFSDALESSGPEATPSVSKSEGLEQLERGEISFDQYLDLRAEQAVGHLAQRLDSEQLDFVKHTLREQLRTDPVLIELVKRATGLDPTAHG
jgi:hypothetical protein